MKEKKSNLFSGEFDNIVYLRQCVDVFGGFISLTKYEELSRKKNLSMAEFKVCIF